jgi:hypothetical protein
MLAALDIKKYSFATYYNRYYVANGEPLYFGLACGYGLVDRYKYELKQHFRSTPFLTM